MRMTKRVLSVILAVAMLLGVSTSVFAAEDETHQFYYAAEGGNNPVSGTVTLSGVTGFLIKPNGGGPKVSFSPAQITAEPDNVVDMEYDGSSDGNSTFIQLKLIPLVNGTTTITYEDGSNKATMEVEVTGIEAKKGLWIINGTGDNYYNHNNPAFFTNNTNLAETALSPFPSGTKDVLVIKSNNGSRVQRKITADMVSFDPIGVLKFIADSNDGFFKLQAVGNGTTTVTVKIDDEDVDITSQNITVSGLLNADDVVIPDDATTEQINAILASKGTVGNKRAVVTLPNKTIDGELVVPNRIILQGRELTVLTGSINVTVEEAEMPETWIRDLTMRSKTTGSGSAIIGTGLAAVENVTIENYEVGIENGSSKPFFAVMNRFINNKTGLQVQTKSGFRGGIGGNDFTVNSGQVGIHVLSGGTNNNEFAFRLNGSNFYGPGVYIKNDSGIDKLNMASNYFAIYNSGKFEGKMVTTPRYAVPHQTYAPGQPDPNTGNYIFDESAKIEAGKFNKLQGVNNKTLTAVRVDEEGADVKIADMKFGADANAAMSINPNIDTVLRDGSAAAVATIPTGTTYQPVSFAHSGALPGTATVNLVKTEIAPTANLKLYKVVGNQLVKQPEAVTFANGEYTFLRDNSSDYIITDAEIKTTGSSSNNDSSDDSVSDYTSSGEVASAIRNASNGVANLSVASRPLVGAAAFDTLRGNSGTTLVLQGDGYSWSFKGSDITTNVPGLVYLNTKISDISPNQEQLSKLAGGKELINVYFSHHGQLPGKATISLTVPSNYHGKSLNVYYYNEYTGAFEAIRLNAPVQNGRLSFDITHCSDYVVTPEVLPTALPINPATGRLSSNPPLVSPISVLMIAVCSVSMLRSKNKKAI